VFIDFLKGNVRLENGWPVISSIIFAGGVLSPSTRKLGISRKQIASFLQETQIFYHILPRNISIFGITNRNGDFTINIFLGCHGRRKSHGFHGSTAGG
jgi:hypothetical protein